MKKSVYLSLVSIMLTLFPQHIIANENSLFASATDLKDKTVLWIGTSIPAGCTYPKYACQALGMKCINKSIGASFLSAKAINPPFTDYAGNSLMMSSEEKESICRPYVDEGELDSLLLETWKKRSYDQLLKPYIKEADIIIVDHGYNDAFVLGDETKQKEEDIDWNSKDKTTFIGAFNCLYDFIKSENPDAIIMIGGYFQNTCTFAYTIRGKYVETISKWIATHYQLPLLDVWNYNNIPNGFEPNSSAYFDEINADYGTSFQKLWADADGNVTYFQKFCPDGVHPFTDPTGESDAKLNAIVLGLLQKRLLGDGGNQELGIDNVMTDKPLSTAVGVYSIDGIRRRCLGKNINIIHYSDGSIKKVFGNKE